MDEQLEIGMNQMNDALGRIADALEALAVPSREKALTTAFERGERRRAIRREMVGNIAYYRACLKQEPSDGGYDGGYTALIASARAKLREFDREGH